MHRAARSVLPSAFALLVAFSAGCTPAQPRDGESSRPPARTGTRITADDARGTLEAFRRALSASRDVLRLVERLGDESDAAASAAGSQIASLDAARRRATLANAELRDALVELEVIEQGGATTEESGLVELLAPVERVLAPHDWIVFYTGDGPGARRSLGSLAVGHVAWRELDRTLDVDGDTLRYDVVHLDGIEIGDFLHERAAAAAGPGDAPSIFRPAFIDASAERRRVIIDRSAIAAVGRASFFPRLDRIRATAEELERSPERLLDVLTAPGVAPEVSLVDALGRAGHLFRWRSLGPLVAELDERRLGPTQRLERFVSTYARFEEVRAAVTAVLSAQLADAEPTPEDQAAVARAALWAQMGAEDGDPWGAVAGLLALTRGAQLDPAAARVDPRARAFLDVFAEVLDEAARLFPRPSGTSEPGEGEREAGVDRPIPGVGRPARTLSDLLRLDSDRLRGLGCKWYRRERAGVTKRTHDEDPDTPRTSESDEDR